MSDTTNDIEALLAYMETVPRPDLRANLTALVAERDALKQRVAELEALPPADRDRELRERLVCAALAGVCIQEWSSNEAMADFAVSAADATLAAMRKGEA